MDKEKIKNNMLLLFLSIDNDNLNNAKKRLLHILDYINSKYNTKLERLYAKSIMQILLLRGVFSEDFLNLR